MCEVWEIAGLRNELVVLGRRDREVDKVHELTSSELADPVAYRLRLFLYFVRKTMFCQLVCIPFRYQRLLFLRLFLYIVA